MDKKILINVEAQEKRVGVLQGKVLEEFYVERTGSERLVGNIYCGVVKSIHPGIQAAFVDIGLAKNGFLYVSDIVGPPKEVEEDIEETGKKEAVAGTFPDAGIQSSVPKAARRQPASEGKATEIKDLLKRDQEVLVQIVKEPLGTKGVRLTTHITLPGRYLVLMPDDPHRGISKRIEDGAERERLRGILEKLKTPRGMGVIVRTAGEEAGAREFERDLRYLTKLWNGIRLAARRSKAPVLVHQDHDLILRLVRDVFTRGFEELVVDFKAEFRRINHFLSQIEPELKEKVKLYQSEIPLFEKYDLEKTIEEIYKRRVELKCGGYIVIEPAEALVAIDVNTGKFTGKKSLEETALKVNLEAAEEIARQIKLRDMGGIVVIDFIDMGFPAACQKVMTRFRQALESDRARTSVLSLSELGLVEMTRQRMRRSLESTSYEICPYCRGRGSVKTVATVSIQALRKIRKFLEKERVRRLRIILHPRIASRLLNVEWASISRLENRFKCKLIVEADPDFHVEEIKVKAARQSEDSGFVV